MRRKICGGINKVKLNCVLMEKPDAIAEIEGSEDYPQIYGRTLFYKVGQGVLVETEVDGLPWSDNVCGDRVFGYHIHSGEYCKGNMKDAFADTMGHYNPDDCIHPHHAGDMPPLFGNNGYAFSVFLTNRFYLHDIVGKTIIIHLQPDDFYSQPSGNSGIKIACGVIKSFSVW